MKTENMSRIIMLVCVAAFLATACTEKIDLNLKSSTPQLVIEGNVSDLPGPYFVALTKSKVYSDSNNFAGVPGAIVVLSDDAGNTDTLSETFQGLYQTHTIQGVAGRTYHLQVTAEGKTYDSYCMMHTPVDIDSIIITSEQNFNGSVKLNGRAQVQDPAGVRNFYRVVSVMDEYTSSGFSVHSDRLWDGKLRTFSIPHSDYHTGDTLSVQLWSIDEHIYQYFYEFNQNQNNFGAPAAPSTPNSVFAPDALGYFSAHSVKAKTIIIQ